jgi:hypothetical protein
MAQYEAATALGPLERTSNTKLLAHFVKLGHFEVLSTEADANNPHCLGLKEGASFTRCALQSDQV